MKRYKGIVAPETGAGAVKPPQIEFAVPPRLDPQAPPARRRPNRSALKQVMATKKAGGKPAKPAWPLKRLEEYGKPIETSTFNYDLFEVRHQCTRAKWAVRHAFPAKRPCTENRHVPTSQRQHPLQRIPPQAQAPEHKSGPDS